MPANFLRKLWRGLGSLSLPPQISDNSIILASTHGSHSLHSAGIRPQLSVGRRVTFSPSTLDHQRYRMIVRQAEPSAFKNFLRDMFNSYYELKMSEEQGKYGFAPDQPLGSRRLAFDDIVQMHRVANDMWRKMSTEHKQKYKQLAKEAVHRRRLRLPPDPYRVPPNILKSQQKKHLKGNLIVSIRKFNGRN